MLIHTPSEDQVQLRKIFTNLILLLAIKKHKFFHIQKKDQNPLMNFNPVYKTQPNESKPFIFDNVDIISHTPSTLPQYHYLLSEPSIA